jgi:putative transposase
MPAKNLSRINKDGIYLHIYNKGIENRAIFSDEEDIKVFLGYLEEYLTTPKDPSSVKKTFNINGRTYHGVPHQPKNYFNRIDLVAYSLMSDHFHLVLYQKTRGSLENFIRSLCTRYSIYFNKKYQRSGSLFAGPYKSAMIEAGDNLSNLSRYLHHLGNHSSYPEYLGSRKTAWVKTEAVLSYFQNSAEYKGFVDKYSEIDNTEVSKLILETQPHHLERRNLSSNQNTASNSSVRKRSKIPKFIATSMIIVVLLFSLAIGYIQLATPKIASMPTQSVLSETTVAITEATQTITARTTPELPAKTEIESFITLVIDSLVSLNIAYILLALVILLCPLLVFIAYLLIYRRVRHQPKKPEASQTISEETEPTKIGISDIDKRVFLKLIGSAGLFIFLFSLFNKKAEGLFFKSLPGSVQGSVSLTDTSGKKIDPAQSQPLDGYRISEVDDNLISFYGYTNKDGAWFVMRVDTNTGSFRYATGETNFPSNWNDRQNLKYDYFNNIFK